MKKTVLFFCLLLMGCRILLAQEKEKSPTYRNSFIVKFAPVGMGIGKITAGGEFNFRRKQSITLMLGVPFNKTRNITYDNKPSDIISSARSAMLGYRYYLGKKASAGFYAEVYAKYVKFSAAGFLNGDLNGQSAKFDSHFNYKGFGGGVQIGYQFYIAKKIAMDFYLLGPEANAAKFASSSTDVYDNIPWTLADAQQAEADIKDNLKKIPWLGDKIAVVVDTNAKNVSTSFSGFMPGFRAGLSVGVRF